MARRVLLALAGAICGAASGLLVAFVLVYLWFDVFGLPALEDGPKPGLGMIVVTAPLFALAGSIGGAIWLVRCNRAGRRGVLPLLAFGGIAALVLTYLVMLSVV